MQTRGVTMEALLEAHTRLVAALRSPSCYKHPATTVDVIETHISTVLLAGAYAYKIKKPIRLPFLDFSTLAKRQHYCVEEHRLNCRLAPEWYLGVVPIVNSGNEVAVEGEGKVLDYALKMRRFPQQALLDCRLAAGELLPDAVTRLADCIALFHRRAARADETDTALQAEQRLRPVTDNLAELNELLATDMPAERIAFKRAEEFLSRQRECLAAWFEERQAHGYVRECHGDLHLGNVALLAASNELVVFDAIEFDPLLRWLDVIDEVAFTTMDLEHRQANCFSGLFLNAYLQRTGDYAGLTALRFYQCHRALVRAKVNLLRAQQLAEDAEGSNRSEALNYLHQAAAYTDPGWPQLVITHGPSASGKSTLARQLSEHAGFIWLRADIERKRLGGLSAETQSGSALNQGLYTPEATDKTYRHMFELAESLLGAGFRSSSMPHSYNTDNALQRRIWRTGQT
ncbi:hypothetical protein CAL65_04580 [Alkalilimnicola ehrlichii]|uniref:Aminoglycoside phosphotransferase domain-containing protein n=1 Tax=Alkalilimnicola ehrlichii TaxID=351052 RepID=A0A3E0X0A4_9GAMM|nr:AAA family ATPase [Alkalilimnicola ehrlichii]RFA38615.1 hypothetical protein CAL65_04580 [Alkalilimnicola ehrlichii]